MSAKSGERESKGCNPQQQHKIGISYFVIAGIIFIVGIFVAFAGQIFGVVTGIWGGWSIFYWIGLFIELIFILFLFLGLYRFNKCCIKKGVTAVEKTME